MARIDPLQTLSKAFGICGDRRPVEVTGKILAQFSRRLIPVCRFGRHGPFTNRVQGTKCARGNSDWVRRIRRVQQKPENGSEGKEIGAVIDVGGAA